MTDRKDSIRLVKEAPSEEPYSRWKVGMMDDLGFLITIDVEPHQSQPSGRLYLTAEEARYVAWRLLVHADACERLNADRGGIEDEVQRLWDCVGGKRD